MRENNSNISGQGTNSQPSGSEQRPRNEKKKQKQKSSKKKPSKKTATSEFKSSISELNGHVFEVHYETTKTNQFTRTCEEIRKYVSRKYDYGGDSASMMEGNKFIDFDKLKPKHPAGDGDEINPTDKRI